MEQEIGAWVEAFVPLKWREVSTHPNGLDRQMFASLNIADSGQIGTPKPVIFPIVTPSVTTTYKLSAREGATVQLERLVRPLPS
jgi:hypothetical protein